MALQLSQRINLFLDHYKSFLRSLQNYDFLRMQWLQCDDELVGQMGDFGWVLIFLGSGGDNDVFLW